MVLRHLDEGFYPSSPSLSNKDLDLLVDNLVDMYEFLGLSPQLCQKKGRNISLEEK